MRRDGQAGSLTTRQRVLLYSPDLDGHRQVYCERWARVLLERGHEIVIAAALARAASVDQLPGFTSLLAERHVRLVDVTSFRDHGAGSDVSEVGGLITRVAADVTVLLEADDHLRLLCGQIGRRGRRLPGRRLGLFIRSTNYRYAKPPMPMRARLGWLRRLPTDWPAWPRLFHERLLPRRKLLDAALCLDEYAVRAHRDTYRWMPDLYESSRHEDSQAAEGGSVAAGGGDFGAKLRHFTAAHDDRELLVYYGTAYARRGYDTLLRLAVYRGACFVHCGRRNDYDKYAFDVVGLRDRLRARGDLLESSGFVADFGAADALFSATRTVVLPYRNHLGSSGVMLQALAARRPVLVPDAGLMAARVRDHGLGDTYRPSDWDDLRRRHEALWSRAAEPDSVPIDRFLRHFSNEQVERAIIAAVEGSADICRLPGRAV